MGRDTSSLALEKGMPAAVETEKAILGSILQDGKAFSDVEPKLKPEHFCLDKHKRIYRRMAEIAQRGEHVDRITLANCLLSHNELEAVDGLTYLVSLDEGMPRIPNLDSYIRIVRDKAALREIIATGQTMMNAALMGEQTPDEILQSAEKHIGQTTSGLVNTKTSFTFGETVDSAGGFDAFMSPPANGIPTGFPCLDDTMYGLQPKLLYVIGGDSSHGKSALLGNIASNIALGITNTEWPHDPTPVGFFSLEMAKEALYRRMACSNARVSLRKLKKGWLNEGERKQIRAASLRLYSAPIYIDETSGLSMLELGSRVRRMVRDYGIKVAAIDYLQLINWRADGMKSEYEGITFATYYCKQLAKELDISMVVLTQFNQEYSRRKDRAARPTLDSCHGSSSVKKDADAVMLIFRLAQAYPNNAEYKDQAELILAKQRDGNTGTIIMTFAGSHLLFTEKPAEEQPGYSRDNQ